MNLTYAQLQAADLGPVTVESGGKEYVLVAREIYDRARPLDYNDSPLSEAEQVAALAHAGKLAGWDDPEMDVYNDLDPRRP